MNHFYPSKLVPDPAAATELLPVDGADEDYEVSSSGTEEVLSAQKCFPPQTVRQNVADIEESLDEVLEKAKTSLK